MNPAPMQALQCDNCGGAIVIKAGEKESRCPFCGAPQADSTTLNEQIVLPEQVMAFAKNESDADSVFRSFTTRRFWAPGVIRSADLTLRRIYLPGWLYQGEITTYYTGLVSAVSPSGKRPVSGVDTRSDDQVLVPASQALTRAELNAIRPFDAEPITIEDPTTLNAPFELALLTREHSIKQAKIELVNRHLSMLQGRANQLNTESTFKYLQGFPVLLPIFIGVYHYKDRPYRVVINGINGNLVGATPISWFKVLAALLTVAAMGAFLLLLVQR